jgi:hypothetical protein
MATTTLYVKDADLPLVEKAKQKLGDSLSAVFIDCIRKRLEELPPPKGKIGKITVEVRREAGAPTIRKSFEGRWLIHPDNDFLRAESDDSGVRWDGKTTYGLAVTKKGALVVYESDPEENDGAATMEIYQDFDELKADEIDGRYPKYPDNVIAAFAEVLGEEHTVDLDI